jgi:flagellin-like protein
MNPTDARSPRRAISPVVGVVLMTAIVVVLAALVASLTLGFGGQLREPTSKGVFESGYVPSGEGNTDDRPYVNLTYRAGETADAETIEIVDESGNSVTWADIWTGGTELNTTEYVHIDGFGSDSALDPICEAGDTYRVTVQNGGTSSTATEWTAPQDPDLPSGSPSDDDGDGIPNWC